MPGQIGRDLLPDRNPPVNTFTISPASLKPVPATTDDRAPRARAGVAVQREGTVLTVIVTGELDANSGVELLAGVQSGIDGATRVDIDLVAMADYTPEGARSLKRARSLSGPLPDGMHFRVAPGVCQEALVEAFADTDVDLADLA
jgi:hypothetical protein